MKEWQSLAHVRWECKYYVVFVPKYRKEVMYGRTCKALGKILRQLCRQKGGGYHRRACDARSYPLGIEHTAEVSFGDGGWIPEREIGDPNAPVANRFSDGLRLAFAGQFGQSTHEMIGFGALDVQRHAIL